MALQAIQIENRENSGLQRDPQKVSSVAAKAFSRIAEIWDLDNASASALLDVSTRTWGRVKSGDWTGQLKKDQLMRISAITGLYKALHLNFGDELADQWVNLANDGPLFRGRTPITFMTEGGLPAQMETRNYVDALRGGL